MFMKSKSGLFRALGDPTRYKLVSILMGGERCACELPFMVKRAQPTVSLQLKFLTTAGILRSRREGKKVLYRINGDEMESFLKAAGMG